MLLFNNRKKPSRIWLIEWAFRHVTVPYQPTAALINSRKNADLVINVVVVEGHWFLHLPSRLTRLCTGDIFLPVTSISFIGLSRKLQ